MSFGVGQIYSGFLLKSSEELSEIEAVGYRFEHQKTGAILVAIKNSDTNKFCAIGFRTIPSDSTGVPHILEHCVLSGSRKYPLKDVFGELEKMGLKTYLNALTMDDRTFYPFATRNAKEYFETMDVYLDVVFHPLLSRNTFLREGWHHHLENTDDELEYNGIVYNEMKGVFSDPRSRLDYELTRNLYPGSTYAAVSGGLPQKITSLTYEQFCDFHRQFYHPSNSSIYLYGDADLNRELATVNEQLMEFENLSVLPKIRMGGSPSEQTFARGFYPVSPDEQTDERTYHEIASEITTVFDEKTNLAMGLLSQILHDSNASPLKLALLEAGICKEVSGHYDDFYCCRTVFKTLIQGSDPEHAEKFANVYKETLKDIAATGIDHDLIEAEVNRYRVHLLERDAAGLRGFSYLFRAFAAVAYNKPDVFVGFKRRKMLQEIVQEALHSRLLENLIEKHLLDNPHTVIQSLIPDPHLSEKEEAEIKKELESFRNTLSPDSLKDIVRSTHELKKDLEGGNSEESLRCLPRLGVGDIDRKVKSLATTKEECGGISLLAQEVYTNGLVYLQVGFDLSALPEELLPLVSPFATLLTEMGTPARDPVGLSIDLAKHTSGLFSQLRVVTPIESGRAPKPMLWFTAKLLPDHFEKGLDLLCDIFANTAFADLRKMKEILEREFSISQAEILSSGEHVAMNRARSYLSSAGRYVEMVTGFTAYKALSTVINQLAIEPDAVRHTMLRMKEALFAKSNVIYSVTGGHAESSGLKRQLTRLSDVFPAKKVTPLLIEPMARMRSEAFMTPSEVVYVAQGGNLYKAGGKLSGVNTAIKRYLESNYLYQKVRVLGGAYGAFVSFDRLAGDLILLSYRDPNIGSTFEAYKGIPDALSELSLTGDAFEKLLVRSFGDEDPLLDPLVAANRAVDRYLAGLSPERVQQNIESLLSCSLAELRAQSEVWRSMLSNSSRAVIGNRRKIEEVPEMFTETVVVS